MDLFTSMRVFTRVVEAGSLTSAAERSDISTTMVSKHVRYLEERLGTSLILRTTRRQTVTPFGKLYYRKCVEILEGIQALENAASEGAQEAKGILRISISRSFGASAFMGRIGDFMKQHPGIAVDLRITDSVLNLVEAGLDAAIRLGELPDSELIAKRLGTYRLWVCAAPSYLETCDRPQIPLDLKNLDCLCFSYAWASEWHGREREWRFLGQNGPEVVEVRGRLMMNDASALHRCVLRGMGIAVLPEILVREDIEAGRLTRVLSNYELPSRPMHLVYPPSSHMPARLRFFIDYVSQTFGQLALPGHFLP